MTDNVLLSNLVHADVFKVSGEPVGTIDELLVDPYTGIVRSFLLIISAHKTIKLPWLAMRFDKSRQTFLLTPIGESIIDNRVF